MIDANPPQSAAQLLDRVARLVHGVLYAGGMAPAQWQSLDYLARANRFSRTPGGLGLFLGATKGTVSQTVGALVRRGLVAKVRGARDRRSVSLKLTARGRLAVKHRPGREIGAALATLPGAVRINLDDGLALLLRALIAGRGGRSFGVCSTCRFFERDGSGQRSVGPHRCGLLGEALSDSDSQEICAEHEPAATSPQASHPIDFP